MFKKLIASAATAGLLSVSVAASAAPIAFQSADRAASPVGETEELGGSPVWLILLFAAIAAGIIVAIESNEGDVDTLPVSP